MVQDFTAWPSSATVQAPQMEVSQPMGGPVNPTISRLCERASKKAAIDRAIQGRGYSRVYVRGFEALGCFSRRPTSANRNERNFTASRGSRKEGAGEAMTKPEPCARQTGLCASGLSSALFRRRTLSGCHGARGTLDNGRGHALCAGQRGLVLAASRTATLSGDRQNGRRAAAAALAAQRQNFQVHDDFFDLRTFLAEGRQDFIYIHLASRFKMRGSISIYTLVRPAVKQNLHITRAFPQNSPRAFSVN
jgi:hypothetical protein